MEEFELDSLSVLLQVLNLLDITRRPQWYVI